MEEFEFDIKKCIDAKTKLNKISIARDIYKKKCSYSNYIGNCTNLYHKLKPVDYLDFYLKELKYAEENQDLKIDDRGLTYDEFVELARKYKILVEDKCNINYDLSVYFYALVCHAIIETFVGQKKEQTMIKYIKEKGFDAQKVEGKKDAKKGVDIEVSGNGKHFYVQVKPIKFFTAPYNDTQEDREAACMKREYTLKYEGLDTYYIIYELDWETSELKWITNKDGGLLFKIHEIFDYDKDNIKGTYAFKGLPSERMVIPN